MWVLSTDRAELHRFNSPEDVTGGYAILSHVWDDREQTLQDIRALPDIAAAVVGGNPRDFASPKIRECCKVAERDGYKWLWIDTCCIDKTSSSELSEAINSMFRYYSLAAICYAYLRDVPSGDNPDSHTSKFRGSRWHTRGWTLQELIAPTLLLFLSEDWHLLGTKAAFADLLQEITRVPSKVLKLEQEPADVSVAQRMSWAADRETTRMEDQAYCLMGIFSINMPTLYGEGRQAFRRFQEEIMKKMIDPSLFVWGACSHLDSLPDRPQGPGPDLDSRRSRSQSVQQSVAPRPVSEAHSSSQPQRADPAMVHDHKDYQTYLLAASPSDFEWCKEVSFIPSLQTSAMLSRSQNEQGGGARERPRGGQSSQTHTSESRRLDSEPHRAGIPTFSVTPYGVLARLPVFEASQGLVALLFCYNSEQNATYGLVLTPCPIASDPLRPLFHTGRRVWNVSHDYTSRILALACDTHNIYHEGQSVTIEWREIYIAHLPPPNTIDPTDMPRIRSNASLSPPFHIPVHEMRKFVVLKRLEYHFVDISEVQEPWNGSMPMVFTFGHSFEGPHFRLFVTFGRCTSSPASRIRADSDGSEELLGPHWAHVNFYEEPPLDPPHAHACAEDHIREWPNSKKTFEWTGYHVSIGVATQHRVTLAFSPWPLNPGGTLAVQVLDPAVKLEDLLERFDDDDDYYKFAMHLEALGEHSDTDSTSY